MNKLEEIAKKYGPRVVLMAGLTFGGSSCDIGPQSSGPDYQATQQALDATATTEALRTGLEALQATATAQAVEDEIRAGVEATVAAQQIEPTVTPTAAATATQETVVQEAEVEVTPEAIVEAEVVSGPNFEVAGVPERAEKVLVASEEFKNSIGLGTEMVFAEPGVLLVGPEFPQETIDSADGAIERISPVNQALLDDVDSEGNAGPTARNVGEGRFLVATGATMRVEVADLDIKLEGAKGHNWFVAIRGLFADGKQDSDLNRTAVFSEYVPGHAQTMMYPEGAFISEGQLLQMAETSHQNQTNCGAEGCSGLSVMMVDLNTKAFTVVHQPQLNAEWQAVADNWR